MRKKLNIFLASILFSIIIWGSISLSDFYYTNIDVNLSLVNLPKGYTTGTRLGDKVVLRVKGRGWKLVSLNVGPESEFIVSAKPDSGWQVLSLSDFLESNRWLLSDVDIISIEPDSIRFFVERKISKKLPLNPDLDLEFKPGYGLATNVVLNPDSVEVSGPLSYIKPLERISTDPISLVSLDAKKEVEVGLPHRNGFTYNIKLVEVLLDVQRVIDKQFDNISVEVVGIPLGKEVVLLPNKISVNVRGGIEILGKLNDQQFSASVKYQDLVSDTTGSVAPVIIMPKNVALQYVRPERLRYIIRSF
ncbi:MAG: hypothetical protein P8X47_07310 [Ignavibacteriaceae bacterium]